MPRSRTPRLRSGKGCACAADGGERLWTADALRTSSARARPDSAGAHAAHAISAHTSRPARSPEPRARRNEQRGVQRIVGTVPPTRAQGELCNLALQAAIQRRTHARGSDARRARTNVTPRSANITALSPCRRTHPSGRHGRGHLRSLTRGAATASLTHATRTAWGSTPSCGEARAFTRARTAAWTTARAFSGGATATGTTTAFARLRTAAWTTTRARISARFVGHARVVISRARARRSAGRVAAAASCIRAAAGGRTAAAARARAVAGVAGARSRLAAAALASALGFGRIRRLRGAGRRVAAAGLCRVVSAACAREEQHKTKPCSGLFHHESFLVGVVLRGVRVRRRACALRAGSPAFLSDRACSNATQYPEQLTAAHCSLHWLRSLGTFAQSRS